MYIIVIAILGEIVIALSIILDLKNAQKLAVGLGIVGAMLFGVVATYCIATIDYNYNGSKAGMVAFLSLTVLVAFDQFTYKWISHKNFWSFNVMYVVTILLGVFLIYPIVVAMI